MDQQKAYFDMLKQKQWLDVGGLLLNRDEVAAIERYDSSSGSPERTIAIVYMKNGTKHNLTYNRSPSYEALVAWVQG